MGGPWKDREWDSHAWQPPAARLAAESDGAGLGGGRDYLTGLVIGYIASVLTSVAIMLAVLKADWW